MRLVFCESNSVAPLMLCSIVRYVFHFPNTLESQFSFLLWTFLADSYSIGTVLFRTGYAMWEDNNISGQPHAIIRESWYLT